MVPLVALAAAVSWATAAAAADSGGVRNAASDSGPARSQPRSHIQSVTEIVATPRSAAELGLRLTRASTVLRQQLALTRGAGLVVEEIIPGSRADKAGIRQHDVLVMLDDQLLVLSEQLTALLESADAGTPLACTILRGGRKITVSLGKATPPLAAGGLRLKPAASAIALAQAASAPVDADGIEPPRPSRGLVQPAPETLLRQDPDCQIRVSRGDETRVVITDPQGRVLFNDTIDTPEHRSRMPVSVRSRVEAMERVLESRPAVEIGRLDVDPIQIR
jgi:hypothetical protein